MPENPNIQATDEQGNPLSDADVEVNGDVPGTGGGTSLDITDDGNPVATDVEAIDYQTGLAGSDDGDNTVTAKLEKAPLIDLSFKEAGDVLEWQVDGSNNLILQNTTDTTTLLVIDQDTGDITYNALDGTPSMGAHDHSETGTATIPNSGLDNSTVTVAGNGVGLGGSTPIDHVDLSNIGPDQHHARDHASRHQPGGNDELLVDSIRKQTDIDSASTTSYTTSDENRIFVDPSSAAVSITLSSGDEVDGNRMVIRDVGHAAATNSITVDTASGNGFADGTTSKSLTVDGAKLVVEYSALAGAWITERHAQKESLDTDDLDIGTSDLFATGDFVSFETYHQYKIPFSTTSTSYVSSQDFLRVRLQWSNLPASASAIKSEGRVDGGSEPTDVRLQNRTDGETIFEVLNISTVSELSRTDAYTPTTTGSTIFIDPQIRADDGDASAQLNTFKFSPGVSL